MPFKLSRCVSVHVTDRKRATRFYSGVMGMEVVAGDTPQIEFNTDPIRLFLDEGEEPATVLEFVTDDLDTARKTLEDAGCEVLRWQGKGDDCFIRDPFGLVFNLWEEPEAFAG